MTVINRANACLFSLMKPSRYNYYSRAPLITYQYIQFNLAMGTRVRTLFSLMKPSELQQQTALTSQISNILFYKQYGQVYVPFR